MKFIETIKEWARKPGREDSRYSHTEFLEERQKRVEQRIEALRKRVAYLERQARIMRRGS